MMGRVAWLVVSAAVGAGACSSHGSSVSVDADSRAADAAADLPSGGGDTDAATDLPTDPGASDRWLHASSLGVAFSHFPGRSVMTRTLTVKSSHGPALAWTAEADQPWLTVTAGGMTGGSLVLTANASGLATNQQYLATVRVRSSDPTVRNEQDVRVGLWIGSADPQPVTLNRVVSNLLADPVVPRLYTNTRGTDITIYDVNTGAVAGTFAGVVKMAESMAISSDGAILFVNDSANRRVVALDTATGTQLQRYGWASEKSSGIAYARPNGHPMIILGNNKVFDVDTAMFHGRSVRIGAGLNTEDAAIAVDADDQVVYMQDHGSEPSKLDQYQIDFDPRNTEPLQAMQLQSISVDGFGATLCVAADGTRLFMSSGSVFGAAELQPLPRLPSGGANNACGWNGLVVIGDDVYRSDGAFLGAIDLPNDNDTFAPQRMALSGDNTRIAGVVAPYQGTALLSIRSTPSP